MASRGDIHDEWCDGWALMSIAEWTGISEPPAAYIRLKHKLIRDKQVLCAYVQPTVEKNGDVRKLHARGAYTRIEPHLRLVDVSDDPWLHMLKASRLAFPVVDLTRDAAPMYHACADFMAEAGASIGDRRKAWIERWNTDFVCLASLDEHIAAHVPEDVRPIMEHSRLASLACLIEAAGWGDWDPHLVYDLFHGAVASGSGYDGDPSVRETRLFRPVAKNADYSIADLHSGRACMRRSTWAADEGEYGQTFEQRELPPDPLPSTQAWLGQLRYQIPREAEAAMEAAGVTREVVAEAIRRHLDNPKGGALERMLGKIGDEPARERLRRLAFTEAISAEECTTQPPTMAEPMDSVSFRQWAADKGGENVMRPGRRHCLIKGVKPDGSVKMRSIDDFRRSGQKGCTTIPGGVDLPSWLFIIIMASLIARAYVRRHLPVPAMTCGLDDLKMAYRMVSQLMWPFLACLIVYYSFRLGTMVVQRSFGQLFGGRASNYNFARVPRLVCYASVTWFAAPYHAYVDDFMAPDVLAGGQTCHDSLACVLRTVGFSHEEKKRKPHEASNIALGALTDLSCVHTEMIATVEPDPVKCEEVLCVLRKCRQQGKIERDVAMTAAQRLRWMTTQLRNKAGTAMLQSFDHHARGNNPSADAWTEDMSHSLEMIETIFDPRWRPKVRINVLRSRPDDEPCVIAYTDCSTLSEVQSDGSAREIVRASVLVYDQGKGSVHTPAAYEVAHCVIPDEYVALFADVDNAIYPGELTTAVALVWSLGPKYKGRRIVHFVDNAAALSNLINGYAGRPDCARLVNLFHLALFLFEIEWYGEWVPSAANMADIMTRPSRYHELDAMLPGLSKRISELKLPPLGAHHSDLRAWCESVLARRDAA